ncbi:hypothetical protein PsYK624_055490 [Phanerochaete sordida]|uniref:Uncharacterized protein n=1 Tax=Phanerochaete sordida TaxID=48140 RepID=A0A9P3G599_9APHY|nr:hypothetical protein PsYK624_055490 [Phanerochaete sordida]
MSQTTDSQASTTPSTDARSHSAPAAGTVGGQSGHPAAADDATEDDESFDPVEAMIEAGLEPRGQSGKPTASKPSNVKRPGRPV